MPRASSRPSATWSTPSNASFRGNFAVMKRVDIAGIERVLGYRFYDRTLVETALTHPSAVEGMPRKLSYERLEFLGDSILGA